jgi:hypothetical protein
MRPDETIQFEKDDESVGKRDCRRADTSIRCKEEGMSVSARIVLTLAASALVAAISGYLAASWAIRKSATIPEVITARQFVLVDEAGHVGAKLTWEDHQPAIRLFDRTNHVRSALFLEPNGVPDLYLYDGNAKVRAALNLFDSGVPNLAFLDETEKYMVWTEYDKERSYNTTFASVDKDATKMIARRRITADGLGLHVRDTVEKAKASQ